MRSNAIKQCIFFTKNFSSILSITARKFASDIFNAPVRSKSNNIKKKQRFKIFLNRMLFVLFKNKIEDKINWNMLISKSAISEAIIDKLEFKAFFVKYTAFYCTWSHLSFDNNFLCFKNATPFEIYKEIFLPNFSCFLDNSI